MAAPMKKTFYYNIFPSKAEEREEAEKVGGSGGERQISRVLIEIPDLKDYQPPPPVVHNDPRRIIKAAVSTNEITMGMFFLTFNETFEHIFRYWTADDVNSIIMGFVKIVTVCDVTDYPSPDKSYRSSVYFQRGHTDDYYILRCPDLIRERCVKVSDEIGLAWDGGKFLFKVLSRSKRMLANNAIRIG